MTTENNEITPENRSEQDVVFIDAYNLIYRAFYGNMSNLKNDDGVPTNAIFTFIKMIEKLPASFTNFKYSLVVFDGGSNFRKDLDENYKAQRKEMPEDLKVQMPYIREALDILGWKVLETRDIDVEADDAIGTLAKRAVKVGYKTYIVSGDKDFRQLINENLNIIDTMRDICYDREVLMEKMEITPENVIGYLALLGDSADNIEGVEKVGEKTAVKLLNEYGDIEGIRDNQDKIKGVVGENIRKAFESGKIDKNLMMVKIKDDVELNLKKKDITKVERDEERWIDFCKRMNFKSFLNQSQNKP